MPVMTTICLQHGRYAIQICLLGGRIVIPIFLKMNMLLCLYPIRLISSDKPFTGKVYVAHRWCFQLFHAVQAVRLTDSLCRLHYQQPGSNFEVIQSKHNQGSSTQNENVKWTGPSCFVGCQMGRSRTLRRQPLQDSIPVFT